MLFQVSALTLFFQQQQQQQQQSVPATTFKQLQQADAELRTLGKQMMQQGTAATREQAARAETLVSAALCLTLHSLQFTASLVAGVCRS